MAVLSQGVTRRLLQLKAMVRKNYLFSLRSWKTTLLQVGAPLIFTLLLLLMDLIPKNPDNNPYNPFPEQLDPATTRYGAVPRCTPFNDLTCLTLRYALNSSDPLRDHPRMAQVISFILEDNGLGAADAAEMASPDDLVAWVGAHPNTTGNGLVFYSLDPAAMAYTILFNATLDALSLYDIRRKPDARNEVSLSLLFSSLLSCSLPFSCSLALLLSCSWFSLISFLFFSLGQTFQWDLSLSLPLPLSSSLSLPHSCSFTLPPSSKSRWTGP